MSEPVPSFSITYSGESLRCATYIYIYTISYLRTILSKQIRRKASQAFRCSFALVARASQGFGRRRPPKSSWGPYPQPARASQGSSQGPSQGPSQGASQGFGRRHPPRRRATSQGPVARPSQGFVARPSQGVARLASQGIFGPGTRNLVL